MKWMIGALFIVFLMLQYRLWVGDGSVANLVQLKNEIETQSKANAELGDRNRVLDAEVTALRETDDAIEERARSDLGMIKKGETFFMIMQSSSSD